LSIANYQPPICLYKLSATEEIANFDCQSPIEKAMLAFRQIGKVAIGNSWVADGLL